MDPQTAVRRWADTWLRPSRCATPGLSPRSTPARPGIARPRFGRCTGRSGGSRPSVAISRALRPPRWSLMALPGHLRETSTRRPAQPKCRAGAIAASEVPLLPGLGDDPKGSETHVKLMELRNDLCHDRWRLPRAAGSAAHVRPVRFLGLFSRRSPARRPARRAPPNERLAARWPSWSMSRSAGPGRF